MSDLFRCSDAARERDDPLLGTAPPQGRLLLIEQDGGWGPNALASLAVPDDVRGQIRERTDAMGTRVMLIRRPGRQTSTVCDLRAWCVVDLSAPAGHRMTWGTWSYPTDLLAAVDRAEELHRGATGAGTPPGDDEMMLLVCTNGRKDLCCAVRGRPVATALEGRWPEQTWECTHTGGDRFAANVVVLPEGATYGGLDVDSAVETVLAHQQGNAGALGRRHLRGLIGHPRPVQAALVGALLELDLSWGQVRVGAGTTQTALVPEDEVTARSGELSAAGTPVARWHIDLDVTDGRELVAQVTEHLRPAAALTCKAVDSPAHSRVPVVESLAPRT